MGDGRRLKEEFGNAVKIVAVEPKQPEPAQGLRPVDDGFSPAPSVSRCSIGESPVAHRDAILRTRKLSQAEGSFVSVSRAPWLTRRYAPPESSTRATSSSSWPTTAGGTWAAREDRS